MARTFFIPVFFLCLFFLPVDASAETEDKAQIGTIIEIEGTGTLQSADTESYNKSLMSVDLNAEKFNLPVYMNDTIETGPASKAHILFIDDTEITLGENASLTVDEYIFDPEYTSANAGRFSITKGAFLFISGLLSKKDDPDVQVDTSYGTIGIRGTKFWGGMVDDEYGVLVEEGEVTVQTQRGRIEVKEGLGTTIRSPNTIPARAHIWSPERISKAQNRVALKRKEAVMRRIAENKENHEALRIKYREKLKSRFRTLREDRKNAPPVYQKKKINKSFDHYAPTPDNKKDGAAKRGQTTPESPSRLPQKSMERREQPQPRQKTQPSTGAKPAHKDRSGF